MPTPTDIAQALDNVKDQQTVLDVLLRRTLEWPIDPDAKGVKDVTYPWSQEDLRAEELDSKIVDGRVLQIQPFRNDQPWGIFLLEFKNPEVFRRDRGMAGTLRRVLRGLVNSRRRRSDLQYWQSNNLLFICNHNYQEFRFASFRSDPTQPSNIAAARIAAFGWGKDDPARRTVCEFNLPHLRYQDAESPQAWVDEWIDAFDVEKVTKRFYADYREVFEELEGKLKGLRGDEERRLAAQTLMNRLMFLRFVERKGWLKFNNRTDYLRALSQAPRLPKQSIYKKHLHPLFFEALGAASGKVNSKYHDVVGDVPFLGGGLFEETPLDEKLEDVPDAQLLKVIGEDGLFYRYNFTVEESTPLDVEVAVDPEMLGKVFEELVTGRHESGSYYTPAPSSLSCAGRPSRVSSPRRPSSHPTPQPSLWTVAMSRASTNPRRRRSSMR